jgi:medium-chain acyl-[acyl-carrier-protein] hydrolase
MSAIATLFEKEMRIHAFECDFNQTWKPAAFFQHLTEIAGEHAEKLGFGYEAMLAQHYFWVLSRFKIHFYDYPKHGETIRVRTWPKTIQQKLFFIRDFEVERPNGEKLACASSAWLVIDSEARRMIPSTRLNFDLPSLSDRYALDEPLEKINLAEQADERLQVTAMYSDVDVLGHVNNGRYVEWICDSFDIETCRKKRPASIQINYINEVRPGEHVSIRSRVCGEDSKCWLMEGINLDSGAKAFEAQVAWNA